MISQERYESYDENHILLTNHLACIQRILDGQDIEILEDVEIHTLVQDSFWTNLVRVEVHNKVRVAKIYSPRNGGKAKFKKDLEFLANHWLASGDSDRWSRPADTRFLLPGCRERFVYLGFTLALGLRSSSLRSVSGRSWDIFPELESISISVQSANHGTLVKYLPRHLSRETAQP